MRSRREGVAPHGRRDGPRLLGRGDVHAIDVHDCFRVWWSYVRSSFVLFDQALQSGEVIDFGRIQAATNALPCLSSMAASMRVDCPFEDVGAADPTAGPRGGLPLVDAMPSA